MGKFLDLEINKHVDRVLIVLSKNVNEKLTAKEITECLCELYPSLYLSEEISLTENIKDLELTSDNMHSGAKTKVRQNYREPASEMTCKLNESVKYISACTSKGILSYNKTVNERVFWVRNKLS